MKFQRIWSSALFLVFAIACAGPTVSGPTALNGTWRTAPENASPRGWYSRSLNFGPDGTFTSEFRSYGIYVGLPASRKGLTALKANVSSSPRHAWFRGTASMAPLRLRVS